MTVGIERVAYSFSHVKALRIEPDNQCADFLPLTVREPATNDRRKLYPHKIRLNRDCSSRLVADSALEVIKIGEDIGL